MAEILIQIDGFLAQAASAAWGLPLAITLLGAGILLTIFLGFPQFRFFFHGIQIIRGKYDHEGDPGEISHFQALTTALSATVGLGNIAGVAVAIHNGGPGATFWMILTGLLGMTTKFSECSLAVMYRHVDSKGVVHGGPMHYIVRGLGEKFRPLAVFFAIACMFGTLGAGNMFQANQMARIFETNFAVPIWVSGLSISLLTAAVILGGIKRIARVTSFLVPFMGVLYMLGGFLILSLHWDSLVPSIRLIFESAFSGTAAVGAFQGVVVKEVIIQGVRRACFSNEAGLGSAPIAHSAAATTEPIREGVVALLEPFVDTVVICTMTALVIIVSGEWQSDLNGVELTVAAFNHGLPGFGFYFIPMAVGLFAYSTLISWSYYGERATDFLFKGRGITTYRVVFCTFTFLGSLWTADSVINFSDTLLALMVVPNLIAVALLFPKLRKEALSYFARYKSGQFEKGRPN